MIKYLTLFLLVFDLALPGFGHIPSSVLSLIISVFYLLFNKNKWSQDRDLRWGYKVIMIHKHVILLYLIIFAWVLIRVSFSYESSFLLSTIKSTIIFIASIFYLIAFYDNNLVKRLIIVFFINSIICFIAGSFPELKDILAVFKYDSNELIGLNPYRDAFLAGSGYFGIASVYIFFFCFYLYLIINSERIKVINILILLSILLASILAGRISIPIAFIAFIYFVLFKRKFSLLFLFVLLVSVVVFLLQLETFSEAKAWINEMFDFNSSISDSTSAATLIDMYAIPTSDFTFFWGDGAFKTIDGSYYMHTDVGYLRHWYFGGIFFMIIPLLIMPLLYVQNRNKFFITFLFPIALLLHAKGLYILNNPSFMPTLYLISFWLIFYNKESKNNYRKE